MSDALPRIIQGGMGVAVSSWRLANAVSRTGQLGVVSGSGMDTVFVRRLQDGDPGGHMRRAMERFPIPGVAQEVLRRYFNPNGRSRGTAYKLLPMYKQVVSAARQRVTVLANFVEVSLAKEGHDGPVGINLLTKVQMPTMPSLYGAMLAGVNVVLMGAGIPREIPGVLDAFAEHRAATIRFDVEGQGREEPEVLRFDPLDLWPAAPAASLERPRFIAIVAAASLAATLARKSNGRVDGFVVEGPTAGGHNAPPRGELRLNDRGEPLYGDRDVVDLAKLRELSLPFWLAGGTGSPEGLQAALAAGAAGIQVGTLFAYCDESGLEPNVKRRVLEAAAAGEVSVRTDPRASPTGYPFKIVELPGDHERTERSRICDIGLLRTAARTAGGKLVYRCPAEPIDAYVSKGGSAADAVGRQCLCNGLVASVGLAQVRAAGDEQPLVTSGDELLRIPGFLGDRRSYTARDVIDYLLS
jgi:NAD(P)H-dependent flavin oxidoreductase YrpB (nitropropane dioxygenase family)